MLIVALVGSLIGTSLPVAATAVEAKLRAPARLIQAAGGAAFDPCGLCEIPSPDADTSWSPSDEDESAARDICAGVADSYDRRELAACEEEAERAIRLLREAGIPWGESELPVERPHEDAPLCRDGSACGPAPAAPVLRVAAVDLSLLSPAIARLAPPPSDDAMLEVTVLGEVRRGFARIPERPPCA